MKMFFYACCIILTGSHLGISGSPTRSMSELPPQQHLRTAAVVAPPEYLVPVIELSDLRHLKPTTKENLQAILQDTGLVSISVQNSPAVETIRAIREQALNAVCSCLADSTARTVSGGILGDGTRRTTLATATIGSTPVPLESTTFMHGGPHDGSSSCQNEELSSLEALRDVVFGISQEFVTALDGLHPQDQTLLKTSHGRSFRTIQDITKASHNLEHFHLYQKEPADDCDDNDTTTVLPIHTDAGLFLVFVPGMDCDNRDSASSDFFVETANGIVQRAIFKPDSFGVLFGAGAEHWLYENPLQVKATRHAVRMRCGSRRAWYGMMHLVPQDAILQDLPQRTFADLRQSFAHSKDRVYTTDNVEDDFVSIGCGPGNRNAPSRVERRRRLDMVEDPSACNNVTNFFCWMSCLAVPDLPERTVATASSLYCLDPRTLDTTKGNVTAAVAVCTGRNGQPGATHNDICVGQWQPTIDGLPEAVTVKENLLAGSSSGDSYTTQFCYGGTSMYMDGFHWLGNTCVIYLFPKWIVSTSGALVGACFGTILFAMALEGVIRLRRFAVAAMPMGTWKRLFCSALFYGLQLTMGYMIMLIVMTYSGPLFLSAILGLVGGHIVFNADQAYTAVPTTAPLPKETSTVSYGSTEERPADDEHEPPCCRPDTDHTTNHSPNLMKDVRVPEGCTPCCQNTL